jgi:hypothetical protein
MIRICQETWRDKPQVWRDRFRLGVTLSLSLFVFPVTAQEAVYMPQERDDLEIRESSEGHFAEIAYVNEVSQISNSGRHVLMWGGETIIVDIEVRSGPEIIRITPPNDLMAVPDYAEVPDDGVPFIIQIMRPMF